MKKSIKVYISFLLLAFIWFTNPLIAQVGFNNPNPHPSSLVDLTAYDKGFLFPRMTSLQRVSIAGPANGLIVFDTDLNALCEYDTISNPDKWIMINPWKADAQANANVILATTGKVGIGVPNPLQKFEVAGNIRVSNAVLANAGVFTNQVAASNFVGDGIVPAGAIIMWYGVTPPAGWKVCDGTNGTPDLRGRFIVGMGTNANPVPGDINPTYLIGTTGGENVHYLTKSELPQHNHTVNTTSTDNGIINVAINGWHSHTYNMRDDNDNNDDDSVEPETGLWNGTPVVGNTNSSGSHSHSVSGTTGNGTSDGLSAQSHENRPAYCVLMYIMKQ